MMNNQPISPSQSLPSDVSRPGDSDTVVDTALSLSTIFDPTTLDFGFDSSCFNGLDDTLVYSPLNAFADACWSELRSHTDQSDDCKTFIEENESGAILGNGLSTGIHTVGDFTSYSVGSFPMPTPQHRRNISSRFAAFRAHLPSSLAFVRPPTQ
ncbi:hypothetical protein CPB84DRAFT_1762508 [Gymnopilus junonius]|uniref:Uncharacterized protein n=1 Tax=Gymnopilus junonius TaxID=109634 RepID=A0A9P5NZQ5_GYMJU|nr:hypothetical protein CPB84DRAFT_1762508 [Gymnopilus junonius]